MFDFTIKLVDDKYELSAIMYYGGEHYGRVVSHADHKDHVFLEASWEPFRAVLDENIDEATDIERIFWDSIDNLEEHLIKSEVFFDEQ